MRNPRTENQWSSEDDVVFCLKGRSQKHLLTRLTSELYFSVTLRGHMEPPAGLFVKMPVLDLQPPLPARKRFFWGCWWLSLRTRRRAKNNHTKMHQIPSLHRACLPGTILMVVTLPLPGNAHSFHIAALTPL